MKLKKPITRTKVTEVAETKKPVVHMSEDERAEKNKVLSGEIDAIRLEIRVAEAKLSDLLKKRFYNERYPYKEGDKVVVSFNGNTELTGILEYNCVAYMSPTFFLRPYKKDGGLSNTHRMIYNTDKIVRYAD